MAEWHLKELRSAIERSGWRFVAEHPSDDLYVSASWEFKREAAEPALLIDFGGIDDLTTLPIEQSYGCRARGFSGRGLYFREKGGSDSAKRSIWLADLQVFVASFNRSK